MFKRLWKNEKGLTLIELLAVVVILGIIAAIAVPSIGGIIDNTKRDAHIANAQQLVSSTKLYIAADNIKVAQTADATDAGTSISLAKLKEGNYIANIKDPSGADGAVNYSDSNTKVVVYNVKDKGYLYKVTVEGSIGGDVKTATTYINGIEINALKRSDVKLPGES